MWDVKTGERQAYDLAADPGETRNLAPGKPLWFNDLSARLDAWWMRVEKDKKTVKRAVRPKLKPEALRRIKELGYMQ